MVSYKKQIILISIKKNINNISLFTLFGDSEKNEQQYNELMDALLNQFVLPATKC